jgi:hypothetical protein
MTTPTLHHDEADARHRFSVEEYFALSKLGILSERTELIEGDIYDMSAHSPRHRGFVDILVDNFKEAFRGSATIFSQSTLAFEGWSHCSRNCSRLWSSHLLTPPHPHSLTSTNYGVSK